MIGVIFVRPPGIPDAEWTAISAALAESLYAMPVAYALGVERPAEEPPEE